VTDFPASIKSVRKDPEFPTSIRLTRSLKADLKKFAKLEGCSFTELGIRIWVQWVEWRKKQK
jgi:hypothetical protein